MQSSESEPQYSDIPFLEQKVINCFDFPIPQFNKESISKPFYGLYRGNIIPNYELGYLIEEGHIIALCLNHQNLMKLPANIDNLSKLRLLSVCFNNLTELPDSIGNLRYLRYLNILGNQIHTLPMSFSKLKHLRTLNYDFNGITQFPIEISFLWNLRKLTLSQNRLQHIPNEIKKLRNIRHICLSSNELKNLPDTIGDLPHLNILQIQYNQITELPDTLVHLKYLHFLDFDFEKVIYPPPSMTERGLASMQVFWMKNGEFLMNITTKIRENQKLTEQDLKWPYFTHFRLILEQFCDQYPTETSKIIRKKFKTPKIVKNSKTPIWL